jgi:WD40 repeat protein
LWDVDAGTEVGLLPGRFVTAHFTPDGRKLLACGAAGVFCWPVQMDAAGQSMRIGPAIQLARESDERRSSLTSDGAWLAATDRTNNTAELFELSTLKRSRVFSGIERIAFARLSPDGRWCVGGTWPEHQLAIWDSRTGELVQRMEVDGPPNASFNPAGTRLIVNGRNHGWVYSVPGWNLETEIARHPAGGFGVPCHSPDGRILAMTRNGYLIQLLDATTYEELATLELTQPLSTGELAFSPDGTRLAGASGANATMLWDLRLIRETLAAMNLDWAHPSFPPAQRLQEEVPQIVIDHAGDPQPAGEGSKTVN